MKGGSPVAASRGDSGGREAADLRIAILAARFNAEITDSLVSGAKRALLERGAAATEVETIRVPGAWELPQAAARAAEAERFDGIIALGCVIRGETPHFEFVCTEATLGLGAVARTARIPVAFGVLTTDDLAQARARAGDDDDNKGYESALAVLEMIKVYRRLGVG